MVKYTPIFKVIKYHKKVCAVLVCLYLIRFCCYPQTVLKECKYAVIKYVINEELNIDESDEFND